MGRRWVEGGREGGGREEGRICKKMHSDYWNNEILK